MGDGSALRTIKYDSKWLKGTQMSLRHSRSLFISSLAFLEIYVSTCQLAKCPWCLCMVYACMWLSGLFLEWYRALLCCQAPWGYGLFSPRQSRSPPVIYSLVQIPEIFNMHSGGDGAEIYFNSLPLSLPQNLISCTQQSMGIMCTFSTERLQWSTAIWAR